MREGGKPVKTYEFEVVLAAGTDMTEELADQLFEAGCDDGTPALSNYPNIHERFMSEKIAPPP